MSLPDGLENCSSTSAKTNAVTTDCNEANGYVKGENEITIDVKTGSLRKGMNLLDAVAVIVGGTIGSGIFITPAVILKMTGSFGVSLICWLAGTLIAMCGGLCYVELSLLLPQSGGEFVYILEGYSFNNRNKWTHFLGSLMAFLYSWTAITVIRPASIAIVTLTCSRYLTRPFYLDCELPVEILKFIAFSILILQSFIVCRSVKLMAKINTFITLLKVFSIFFIVIVGIAGIIKRGNFSNELQHPFRGSHFETASDKGGIVLALYSVLWAYEGWNSFGYAVEEVKNPEKNLPRGTLIALTIISICYFLVNISFFSVLSYDEITSTQAVALPFGEAVMGEVGLVIFPLVVAVSTFGSNILIVYMASRLIYSSAREGLLLEVFCGLHTQWRTPVAGIILLTFTSSIYIMAGDISSLIEGFSAAVWLFYLLSFTSILIMRCTHKDLKRPFKIWGIVPTVMIIISMCLIILPLTKGPGWSLAAFGLILCGVPVYIVFIMETPWNIKPAFLNEWSVLVTKHGNRLLQAKSAR